MTSLTEQMWRQAVARGDTTDGYSVWKVSCELKMEEELERLKAFDEKSLSLTVSKRELAAIMTGLNWVHERLLADPQFEATTEDLREVMTCCGDFPVLPADQVSLLIDEVNVAELAQSGPTLGYLYRRRDNGKTVTIGVHKPKGSINPGLEVIELVAK